MEKDEEKSIAKDMTEFIEIDKNALLYICDLLKLEPEEGKLIASII